MIKIGERLLQARKKMGISLEDASKNTKIRIEFLSALEHGDYNKLPSGTYVVGFLRNYADFLNLPTKETIALFKREFDEREHLGVLPKSFTNPYSSSFSIRIGNFGLIISLGIIFIIAFIIFEYKAAFINPQISITIPKENSVISSQTLMVKGKTDVNTIVSINSQQTLIDASGNFSKTISILPSDKTITIKAVNSFGRNTTAIRHITVKPF